jgi:exosortase E/protease (VPEID-CTERM system)
MWVLNVLRITALILIGNAGAPEIAIGGFHSQAGWIGFNGAALAFALAARRLPWLAKNPEASARSRGENPTAAYLIPFLAILAASIVSAAFSSGFETAYPLRLLAAIPVLWVFRSTYTRLDWRFGWYAPLAGAALFALWIFLDSMSKGSDATMAAGLASLSSPLRTTWLVCRTVSAVVIVPIAEELAFRGYLTRRLMSSDFESVGLRSITPLSIIVSSAVFGLMHGSMWVGGILAGLVFALLLRKNGRIGDPIVAHATCNVLLAAWVLSVGHWHLW